MPEQTLNSIVEEQAAYMREAFAKYRGRLSDPEEREEVFYDLMHEHIQDLFDNIKDRIIEKCIDLIEEGPHHE